MRVPPGAPLRELRRLLECYYQGVPAITESAAVRATALFRDDASSKGPPRQIPVGAETTLEVDGRELTLPYHPCLGALFFGREHYAMRRRMLGLPPAAPQPKSVTELIDDAKHDDAERRERARAELAKAGAAAVQPLLRELEGGSPVVQLRIIEAIGAVGLPAAPAVPRLAELLGDREPTIRLQSAVVLLVLSASLQEGQGHADPNVRVAASLAVATLQNRSPVPVVLAALPRADAEASEMLWNALAVGGRLVIDPLVRALREGDLASRALAARGLVEVATRGDGALVVTPAVLAALEAAAKDESAAVAKAAASALEQLRR